MKTPHIVIKGEPGNYSFALLDENDKLIIPNSPPFKTKIGVKRGINKLFAAMLELTYKADDNGIIDMSN